MECCFYFKKRPNCCNICKCSFTPICYWWLNPTFYCVSLSTLSLLLMESQNWDIDKDFNIWIHLHFIIIWILMEPYWVLLDRLTLSSLLLIYYKPRFSGLQLVCTCILHLLDKRLILKGLFCNHFHSGSTSAQPSWSQNV